METNGECQTIPEFFKGKSVLVTGATGFLGKVLVEKLLRSCPGIVELFILLRPNETGDVQKRLLDFADHHVFDRLRSEQKDALQKLRALEGDVTLPVMGLSDTDLEKVTRDISVIFHCAANVRFDDDPCHTLKINLVGVKNALDVCHKCQQLLAFVHVSTAFCFCHHPVIAEEIYPESISPDQVIECLNWMTKEQIRDMHKFYLKGRPSVYHFSKAMAETLVASSSNSIPAIIVRPSIVTASVKEPFPGWIDNYNGPSGFIAVCGKGIVRTLLVKPGIKADWVPVDTAANTIIVAAHYIAVKSKLNSTVKLSTSQGVPIINCTCPENKLITWMQIVDICLPNLRRYPSITVYGRPGGTVTPCPLRYYLCRLMSHYLPALFVDTTSLFLLKKPRMISLYASIHRVMSHLEHYTTHSFAFRTQNMSKLVEQMHPEDKEKFPIDLNTLNWNEYIENYVLGVRKYFLRESDDTLPDARRKMMRIHYFWLALKISSVCGIAFLVQTSFKKGWFLNSILPLTYSAISSFHQKVTLIKIK